MSYVDHWSCAQSPAISLEVPCYQCLAPISGVVRSARPGWPRGRGNPPSPPPARTAPAPRAGPAAPAAPSVGGLERPPGSSPEALPLLPGCAPSGGDHGRSPDSLRATPPGTAVGAPSDSTDGHTLSDASRPADPLGTGPHRSHTDADAFASTKRERDRHPARTESEPTYPGGVRLGWVTSREQTRVISR